MVPWVTWLGYLTGGGQWTGGGSPRVREPSLPALYNNSKRLCAQKLYEKTPELLLNLISIVSYTMGAALPVLLRAVHPSAIIMVDGGGSFPAGAEASAAGIHAKFICGGFPG